MRISYQSRNKATFLIELELKKWGKKKLYNKILGLLRSSCFKNQYFLIYCGLRPRLNCFWVILG